MFFDLHARGLLDGRGARLADVNPDLVGCYRTVRDRSDAVIAALSRLQATHRARGDAFYYEVRDQRFNPARALMQQTPAATAADRYTPALAAMLIFLNRTGFNGLFRLNRDGAFNVPVGRYAAPRICDPEHIRMVATAFGSRQVAIDCAPFEDVLAGAGTGDFVYCDPPYAPLSRTADKISDSVSPLMRGPSRTIGQDSRRSDHSLRRRAGPYVPCEHQTRLHSFLQPRKKGFGSYAAENP